MVDRICRLALRSCGQGYSRHSESRHRSECDVLLHVVKREAVVSLMNKQLHVLNDFFSFVGVADQPQCKYARRVGYNFITAVNMFLFNFGFKRKMPSSLFVCPLMQW